MIFMIIQDCSVDDRANTFQIRTFSGQNYYFQAESFDSAQAWRVTIESMITAAQYEEQVPNVRDSSTTVYRLYIVLSSQYRMIWHRK